MPRPKPDLDALRQQIAALEKRPALASTGVANANRTGDDGLSLLDAPAGLLHEIFADEHRQSGAALGFTLGLAQRLLTTGRQALIYLQLSAEAQEIGLPYGLGLLGFNLAPDSFVIGRIDSVPELLWALEESLACRAVAAVIVDLASHPKALDFTASRRISLRAAAAGTSAFLLRYGTGREASAAQLRWHVVPDLSAGLRFDPEAPGQPRFRVDIEKRRLGNANANDLKTLIVDWTENGFVSADPAQRTQPVPVRPAPASRPQPAALGDRLSEAS